MLVPLADLRKTRALKTSLRLAPAAADQRNSSCLIFWRLRAKGMQRPADCPSRL